ncbi:MAG: NAD(+)/NADH kinase [Acidimicrobiia bacterium]|nr:NAD(+)/NADH kinase [Acidimicrobiia bacterium]
MKDSRAVGVVANPASARDIRRLVAHGSTVTAHQKLNQLRRLLVGLGRTGVERVVVMGDRSGIATGLLEGADRPSGAAWPRVEIVDEDLTGTAADTVNATRFMVAERVGAIVVLGGDGTNRLVADECGDTPIVAISTGTNNAFPKPLEPTVAGMAAGLVATGGLDLDRVAKPAKMLEVSCPARQRTERALVDVAILNAERVGSGAIWEPGTVEELYLCFAPPDGIGLSAIGGHLQPVDRHEPIGLAIRLTTAEGASASDPPTQRVTAPIGPGLIAEINVVSWSKLAVDQTITATTTSGTVAIDGERMFRFDSELTVTLRADGPRVVDVAEAMDLAARTGLLAHAPANGPDPAQSSPEQTTN